MIRLYSTLKTVLIRPRAWRWNQTFACPRTLTFVNGISVGIVTAQPGLTPLTPLVKRPLGLLSGLSISLCFAQRAPLRRGGADRGLRRFPPLPTTKRIIVAKRSSGEGVGGEAVTGDQQNGRRGLEVDSATELTSALFWPGSLFQAYGYPCRCVPFEQQLYAYGERWKSTCVRHGSPPSSLGNIHAHLEQA